MAIHLHIEHQFASPGVPRALAEKMPEELYGHLPFAEYQILKTRIDGEFRSLAAVSVRLNPMRLILWRTAMHDFGHCGHGNSRHFLLGGEMDWSIRHRSMHGSLWYRHSSAWLVLLAEASDLGSFAGRRQAEAAACSANGKLPHDISADSPSTSSASANLWNHSSAIVYAFCGLRADLSTNAP